MGSAEQIKRECIIQGKGLLDPCGCSRAPVFAAKFTKIETISTLFPLVRCSLIKETETSICLVALHQQSHGL